MIVPPPSRRAPRLRSAAGPGEKWTKSGAARFGYLCGLGMPGPQIAEIMGFTSVGAVANACKQLGVQLARRRDGDFAVPVVIAKEARPGLDEAAAIRGIDRKELAARLLNTSGVLGADYVDDVIDDID